KASLIDTIAIPYESSLQELLNFIHGNYEIYKILNSPLIQNVAQVLYQYNRFGNKRTCLRQTRLFKTI
nr:hypothetical protein [Prevotella sp.]